MVNTKNRETISIESAGNFVTVQPYGRQMVEIAIRADGSANYRLDAREDGSAEWVENVGASPEFSGQTDYDETLFTGWYELRIYCVSGTGTPGDEATMTLCAGG